MDLISLPFLYQLIVVSPKKDKKRLEYMIRRLSSLFFNNFLLIDRFSVFLIRYA